MASLRMPTELAAQEVKAELDWCSMEPNTDQGATVELAQLYFPKQMIMVNLPQQQQVQRELVE